MHYSWVRPEHRERAGRLEGGQEQDDDTGRKSLDPALSSVQTSTLINSQRQGQMASYPEGD